MKKLCRELMRRLINFLLSKFPYDHLQFDFLSRPAQFKVVENNKGGRKLKATFYEVGSKRICTLGISRELLEGLDGKRFEINVLAHDRLRPDIVDLIIYERKREPIRKEKQ